MDPQAAAEVCTYRQLVLFDAMAVTVHLLQTERQR
ncbi:hypothetical protein PSYAR_31633, partial [Pseudomonas syringae pv. aceris str. M302273]